MYGKFPVFVWDAAAAGTAVGVPPPPHPQKNGWGIHIYINRKYPVENFLIANVHVWHTAREDMQS
jgi:hypothetical protein